MVGFLAPDNGGVGGKNNTTVTVDPDVLNDNTQGYAPGSIWINRLRSGIMFVQRMAQTMPSGLVTLIPPNNVITPVNEQR